MVKEGGEQMDQYFPLSKKVEANNANSLVIAIVIYLVVPTLFGIVAKVISWIPIIGWLVGWAIGIAGTLLGVYCLAGIILAILNYAKR